MAAKPARPSGQPQNPVAAPARNLTPTVRVALVEDDANLRRTMIAFINRCPGYSCASTFADGESAWAEVPRLKPELVLMDIGLPGKSGIECVAGLKPLLPDTPFVMLTVYDEGDFLFDSLKAGARGYLLKRAKS